MATKVSVRGRLVSRPGVYSEVKSGIKNPPLNLSFGNICFIDTGGGGGFSGGAGINGELNNGKNAIYVLKDIKTMQDFVKGGLHWLLANPLFRPSTVDIGGVSTVYYIKAATTTKATLTYTFAGAGSDGGVLAVYPLDEGLGANGVLVSTQLTRGYGAKLITNPLDSTTFILQFYRGTYRGADSNGFDFDNVVEASTIPELLIQSTPFNNVSTLYSWMQSDSTFLSFFKLGTHTSLGTGAVTAADVAANTGFKLAAGGTETYGATDTDAALQYCGDLDNTFFLCDDYGVTNGNSADNLKILDFVTNTAKYEKFLFIGGGDTKAQFLQSSNSSKALAVAYNSAFAHVVHGAVYKARRGVTGFRQYPSIYKAAEILGRACGLQPQTPVTLKDIEIDGEVHSLNETEQEAALDAGILVSYYDTDFKRFVVLQGINTLQKNTNLINEDGKSHDLAVMRVVSQINKEMQFNAKIKFFGNKQSGANRNTVSEEDLITFMDGFLSSKIATATEDNLLIRYQDLTAELTSDVAKGNYSIVANTPVNKIIMTGTLLDK